MTKQEYADFQCAVDDFFHAEGINCLAADCSENYAEFSNSQCDCCGTHLAGSRYGACGYNPEEGEVFDYNICVDCLYYSEYGTLDDMTMMDLED